MLSIGRFTATIVENGVGSSNSGKMYISFLMQIDQDQIDCKIWLTPKAMQMARKSLSVCGFDIDKRNLQELIDKPKLLAGKVVPVSISDNEYNGNHSLQCNIELNSPAKDQLSQVQAALRAAGKKQDKEETGESSITDDDIPF